MSRCAHAQSTYVLRKLPRCTKCKEEFALVMAVYEDERGKTDKPVEEWECPKCGKVVPRHALQEQLLHKEEAALHEWCLRDAKRRRKYERKS